MVRATDIFLNNQLIDFNYNSFWCRAIDVDFFFCFVLGFVAFFLALLLCYDNIFYVLLALISVFVYVAFFYAVWGFDFLAFLIIIIYVGAILVLFLFIIMLIPAGTVINFSERVFETNVLSFFFFAFAGPEILPISFNFLSFFIWFTFFFFWTLVAELDLFDLEFSDLGLDYRGDLKEVLGPMGYPVSSAVIVDEMVSSCLSESVSYLFCLGIFLFLDYWYLIIVSIFILYIAMVGPIMLLLRSTFQLNFKNLVYTIQPITNVNINGIGKFNLHVKGSEGTRWLLRKVKE